MKDLDTDRQKILAIIAYGKYVREEKERADRIRWLALAIEENLMSIDKFGKSFLIMTHKTRETVY